MKLIFVRHGKDDDRYRGGWSTLDLTEEGMEQAKRLAAHLRENNGAYRITQIISSDLVRTQTTADIISAQLGLPVQKEPRIRETNNGDLAGMRNDIALMRYPGLFFSTLGMDEPYPGGESPRDFYLRIKGWFEDFCRAKPNTDGNILIVTHSGVINIIYHLVNGIEWSNQGKAFKAEICSIHILNTDSMEFELENRTDFLAD